MFHDVSSVRCRPMPYESSPGGPAICKKPRDARGHGISYVLGTAPCAPHTSSFKSFNDEPSARQPHAQSTLCEKSGGLILRLRVARSDGPRAPSSSARSNIAKSYRGARSLDNPNTTASRTQRRAGLLHDATKIEVSYALREAVEEKIRAQERLAREPSAPARDRLLNAQIEVEAKTQVPVEACP